MTDTVYYRGRTVIFRIKNSKNLRPERFRASLGGVRYPPWGRCWRVVRAAGHASVVRTDHICVGSCVFRPGARPSSGTGRREAGTRCSKFGWVSTYLPTWVNAFFQRGFGTCPHPLSARRSLWGIIFGICVEWNWGYPWVTN